MAASTEKHKLPHGAFIAEGRGVCQNCWNRIEIGDTFWWRSGSPPSAECSPCRDKRLKQTKLDRDAGKG